MLWLLVSAAFAQDSDGDGLSDADETLAHLPPTVADSDGDGRFDHLDSDMDGDSIANVDECRLGGVSGLAMVNGGFELPHYTNVAANYPAAGSIPGWQTTDTSFEFWTNGFLGVPPYEGTQFVELNAFAVGTLYQDIPTTVGDVYIYAYSHRGRAGTDTMKFNLGTSGSMTTIRTSSTGVSAWGRYGGVITISYPISRFAFQSVSSACGMSCGNLLDAISFTPSCDLDTDGDGTPDALDLDSDNDTVLDAVDACPGADDAVADPDADGLCSTADACPLDPYNDWDFDGVCGDVDACAGFDDAFDLDGDDMPDGCDSDRDGDGFDESTDCDEDDPLVGGPQQLYWDTDLDGYGDIPFSPPSCSLLPGRVLTTGDCNDFDAAVYPGALELEDSFDQDCDLVIDEGTNAYDDDGDGFSENAGDCDDADALVALPQLWYLDRDEDTHGDPTTSTTACFAPSGYVALADDCDDRSASRNPSAVEYCSDTLDWNCDGSTGYADLDGDRWAACEECNDNDPAIHPNQPEVCGDGIDQDCDGLDVLCPPDTDVPDTDTDVESGVDSDSGDVADSPDAVPVCDSDEPIVAFAGGWSCSTVVTDIVGGLWASLLLAVVSLYALYGRRRE
jgi:hypothetical protein